MVEKTCAFCGRKYLAKTRRSKYCCDTCRCSGNYWKNKGGSPAPYTMVGATVHVPPPGRPITKTNITNSVVNLKGDAAFFDAASKRGPVEYRQMCGAISKGVLGVLRGLGL